MNRDGTPLRTEVAALLQDLPKDRDQLLPALWRVHDRYHALSPDLLGAVAAEMGIPYAEAYGVASFYALFAWDGSPRPTIHLCTDVMCGLAGAASLYEAARRTWEAKGVHIKESPCLGHCEQAPAAMAGDRIAGRVTAPALDALIQEARHD
jgi:NADH:ubiquinone oxidoreductase subunit E